MTSFQKQLGELEAFYFYERALKRLCHTKKALTFRYVQPVAKDPLSFSTFLLSNAIVLRISPTSSGSGSGTDGRFGSSS